MKVKRITVAALRKMAKAKGLSVRCEYFRRNGDRPGTYPHAVIDCGICERGGMTLWVTFYPKTMQEGRDALHAALLTLPDKPKDKKRGNQ